MENYIVINGKKAELTEEQLEKLGIEVKDDCFKRKIGELFFYIDYDGAVKLTTDNGDYYDEERGEPVYVVANYCRDRKIMEQRALHETLDRLLWRFSMQNDGDKLDWKNMAQFRWRIYFNCFTDEFCATVATYTKDIGPYFVSKEVAQRAIDEIIKPFMKENPKFVW